MESATAAAALPRAEVHSVPTSDGTEVRLTRYKFGDQGPARAGARVRQRRARVRDRHRAEELGPVPGRARLRRVAARLPRQPGPAVELHAVHRRRHRDARLAGRDRHGPRARPGRTTIQAMGHCVGGLSLFMAIGGGMQGLRSATFSVLAGHPIPTPGNQARAWARHGDDLQALGIKGLNTDYDPQALGRQADRDGDEGRCRSGTSTTTRSRAASTSSTATSSTTRTSTSRRWSRPCRASSATATSRSSSTSR